MPREIDKTHPLGGQRRSHLLDRRIAALAARQHGVVSHEQLRRIGLSPREIERRVEAGRLHRLHRGVYAVGHPEVSREGRYLAAVLFAGEGACLSHRSAADLWELRASKEDETDVTAASDRRGDATVRIRRDALDARETMTRDGIRVTKPLRTLLDLAACVDQPEVERAIRQAVYRKLTTTTLLAEAVQQRPGQRGTKRLRDALSRIADAPGVTRSPLEERFIAFLRKHKLPLPELNAPIQGYEVDCVWHDQKLIVELDGRDAHLQMPAFESDRARDAALLAAGWPVMRITTRRMRRDGAELASQLRAVLR
jgi:very-short-patch-repair endonuclease/predicted transcriptional regulator of viral defense system